MVLLLLRTFENIVVLGIVKGLSNYWYWYWVLLRLFMNIGIGYCLGLIKKLILGIVKASLEILGIGIGKKSGIAQVCHATQTIQTLTINLRM